MSNFTNVNLDLQMPNSFFYSSSFRDTLIKKLKMFAGDISQVAKNQYGKDDKKYLFIKNFLILIEKLEEIYNQLKQNEKNKNLDQLIKIREKFAMQDFYGAIQAMMNMLEFAEAKDVNGLKIYCYGGIVIPDGMTEKDFESFSSRDYSEAVKKWHVEFIKLTDTVYSQLSKLKLPFPTYKVNEKIFKNNPLWKSSCQKEFNTLFTSLEVGIKNIKDINSQNFLKDSINSSKEKIKGLYKSYEPHRKTQLFKSKEQKQKIVKGRTFLLLNMLSTIKLLHKELTENGYKGYPFVKFLKMVEEKCITDKAYLNKFSLF